VAHLKTQATEQSVAAFLDAIEDPQKRADALAVAAMMREATGLEPAMWGPGMVGFGSYHYVYASGHQGDSFLVGFAPRKQSLVLYNIGGFEQHGELMSRLGKYTTGKGCLYIKRLRDVDQAALRELIGRSAGRMRGAGAEAQARETPS
jgi:hypothetical protein